MYNGGTSGAGLCAQTNARPLLINCTFAFNDAGANGGAVECLTGGAPTFDGCIFTENRASYGAAVSCVDPSATPATFTGCLFSDNVTSHAGGGIRCDNANILVEGCTFEGNDAGSGAGISAYNNTIATVSGCTFYDNSSPYGVVIVHPLSVLEFTNTLIAFNTGSAAFAGNPGLVTLACCDVFGNEGGDWVGPIADQEGENGNIALDPLFCGDANPEHPLTLHADSPCLSQSGCDLIGAWGEGCGSMFVADQSERRAALRLERLGSNPCAGHATFSFTCDDDQPVIAVFDPAGRRIRSLTLSPGARSGTATWDANDEDGRPVASGVYIIRLATATGTTQARVAVIR